MAMHQSEQAFDIGALFARSACLYRMQSQQQMLNQAQQTISEIDLFRSKMRQFCLRLNQSSSNLLMSHCATCQ